MSSSNPGIALASIVVNPAPLGFIPVAIHFDLSGILVQNGPASPEQVTNLCNAKIRERSKGEPELRKSIVSEMLCLPPKLQAVQNRSSDDLFRTSNRAELTRPGVKLAEDTLYIMAGLGLVEQVSENVYGPNAITKHMIDNPGAQHGALHFATEALFGGAFLYRKLKDTDFEWPFKEADGPIQYAHKLMGNDEFSKKHTYSIMADEGRMDSFNKFMFGKFWKDGKTPAHLEGLGYDMDAAFSGIKGSDKIVDIGGSHGNLLMEFKNAYPELSPESLIVQDFYASFDSIPGMQLIKWNFKDSSPQPVQGARIYILQHILHNQPDLEAVALLQKTAAAMNADSRLLIIECTKNTTNVPMHATMITLYGGRERSSPEWNQMATLCGLKVTFEGYPDMGECLVEMRKA